MFALATAVIEKDPPGGDSVGEISTSDKTPKNKPWTRLIPFTRSWQERRRSRKQNLNTSVVPSTGASTPLQAPTLTPTTQVITQTKTEEPEKSKQKQKSLAQYAHHDGKGAVGWVAPAPTTAYREYPLQERVGGQRVLAQYGHNNDKWAVKHAVY